MLLLVSLSVGLGARPSSRDILLQGKTSLAFTKIGYTGLPKITFEKYFYFEVSIAVNSQLFKKISEGIQRNDPTILQRVDSFQTTCSAVKNIWST